MAERRLPERPKGNRFDDLEIEMIKDATPSWAGTFLREHEGPNRPIAPIAVAKYRRDMSNGRWADTGDTIKIDTKDLLVDGRHRLTAHAGCADDVKINYIIVRNVEPSVQWVMDQGRSRSAGQQLAMMEVRDSTAVAAGVRLLLTRADGTLFGDRNKGLREVPTSEIEEWTYKHLDLVDMIAPWVAYFVKSDVGNSVCWAAAIDIAMIDFELGEQFFMGLERESHFFPGKAHPVNVLQDHYARQRRERRVRESRDDLAVMILTWNAFHEGRKTFSLDHKRMDWSVMDFPTAV